MENQGYQNFDLSTNYGQFEQPNSNELVQNDIISSNSNQILLTDPNHASLNFTAPRSELTLESNTGDETELKSTKSSKANEQENEDKEEVNSRSIHVSNVEYKAKPEELKDHFQECGEINRITILCDKKTGKPMGYAYIEFASSDSVDKSLELMNDTMFKGRQITVTRKRINLPGKKRNMKNKHKFPISMRGFVANPYLNSMLPLLAMSLGRGIPPFRGGRSRGRRSRGRGRGQ